MIEYEIINNVGKITFNRPEKFHSINTEFANTLIEYIKDNIISMVFNSTFNKTDNMLSSNK